MRAKQLYVSSGTGARRAVRTKQLHIRVTKDQLALYQLAASVKEVSVSRWAIDLLSAAAVPEPGARRARQQARR